MPRNERDSGSMLAWRRTATSSASSGSLDIRSPSFVAHRSKVTRLRHYPMDAVKRELTTGSSSILLPVAARGLIMFVRGTNKRMSGIQPSHPCWARLPYELHAVIVYGPGSIDRFSVNSKPESEFIYPLASFPSFLSVSTSRCGRRDLRCARARARSGIALGIPRRR